MAVLADWRCRGVGIALLGEILAIARQDGRPQPVLNAQTTVVPFYVRLRFEPVGEIFNDTGGHPSPKNDPAGISMSQDPDLSQYVLGEISGSLELHTLTAIRAAGIHMVRQAARYLRLFSHDLDAALYDDRAFLDEVHRIAIGGGEIPVRVLLIDAEPAIRNGHRLIEMARHLTSRIQIRAVPAQFAHANEAYLLVDDCAYVQRPLATLYEGTADFNAPGEVRRMHKAFDAIWSLGEIHQDLRRLYL